MKLAYKFLSKFYLLPLAFVREINGMENLPEKFPYIVVANHSSFIDPAIIKGLFDRHFKIVVFYLTKKEAYDNFLKIFFLDSMGTIPVDRRSHGKTALEAAIKKLKEGNVIGLFPEGTRSYDGKVHSGKTGAARLALYLKCPILPIGLENTFGLWPRHRKLPHFKKIVVVNIGKPFTLEKYYKKKISKRLLHEITDEIMVRISKLSGQKYVRD